MADTVRIEIAYADERRQLMRIVSAKPPFSVAAALAMVAADPQWHQIDLANAGVGVFGRIVERDRLLCDGERLEIYAKLKIDPKAARRRRAVAKGGVNRA